MEAEKIIKEKEIVHEDGKKEYASKGLAGTALGFGIGGAVLGAAALWGRRGGWGGGGMPENVNINTLGGVGGGGHVAPTAFEAWEKECEDALALTNTIWSLKVNTMEQMYAQRQTDVHEKFGLYKSQIDADFGLYKNQRDMNDATNARISALETQVAVNSAIRPYQDKLIQCEIDKAFTAGINYVDRKVCRMITGELVLPSTPTVTGYPSYNACCQQPAPAPAV